MVGARESWYPNLGTFSDAAKFELVYRIPAGLEVGATYGGKPVTTADFQNVVERHMVPALSALHNGKADWFFNQWVYGTDTPRYVTD